MAGEIKQYDTVLIKKGKCSGAIGRVRELTDGKAKVYVYDDQAGSDKRTYALSSLELVPPLALSADELRDLARFESGIVAKIMANPHVRLITDAEYLVTLDDLEVALQRISSRWEDSDKAATAWYFSVFEGLEDAFGIWDIIDGELETDEEEIPGVPSMRSVMSDVFYALEDRYDFGLEDATPLAELIDEIRLFRRSQEKPLAEREMTQQQLIWFLKTWDNDRVALFGTQDITALYVRAVNELADADVPIGLHEKAYACYGKGNAGFDEDWEESLRCLLRLEEIDPKSQYANTLGYMYYYGFASGGEPDYEKAFYWFSIGAAGGVYASRYKIADMIKDGKGCHKDHEIAAHAVWDLYNENLEYFCRGIGRTKFADIVWRVGNLYRDGIDCQANPDSAFAYYLMAKLAIRMRRQCCDIDTDERVERNIDNAIESVLPDISFAEKADVINVALDRLLRFAVGYGRRVRMDYRQTSDSGYRLAFRIEDRPDKQYASKIPVLVPEAHFCGLLEKVVVKARLEETSGLEGKSGSVVFDKVDSEWKGSALSMYGEELVTMRGSLAVDCQKLAGENRRYVSVSFDDPARCWDYLCDDENVVVGSRVRVPFGKRVSEGVVKRVTERFDCEVELPVKAYKRVLELL